MSEIEEIGPALPVGAAALAVPKAPEKVPEAPAPIDPVLIEKMGVCRQLNHVSMILQRALVPGNLAADILGCQEFLKGLYAPIFKECESHPDFKRAMNPEPPKIETPQDKATKAKAQDKRKRKESKARARSN